MAELQSQVGQLQSSLSKSAAELADLNNFVDVKDTQLNEKNAMLISKDKELQNKDDQISQKNSKIKQMDEKINAFEKQLQTLTKGSEKKLPSVGGFIQKY